VLVEFTGLLYVSTNGEIVIRCINDVLAKQLFMVTDSEHPRCTSLINPTDQLYDEELMFS
jgi:hypothetical protein